MRSLACSRCGASERFHRKRRPNELRRIPVLGIHFRLRRGVELWFFRMRLHVAVTWSGHSTSHLWRIRHWGFGAWVEDCIARADAMGEPQPQLYGGLGDATRFERLVAFVARRFA